MSDAFPEPEVLEERSLEEREHAEHPLPDDVDEADAIDQARPVAYDDEDDWREG